MFKQLLALVLLVTSVSAYAGGDRVGNGGDVVVCGNQVELLDIFEARLNGHTFYHPPGSDYKEMLKNVLERNLKEIQPKRYKRYSNYLETFESEAVFYPGIQLNDIDDAGMVTLPTGCKLEQIIIQLSDNERPPGKKRYSVSLDLWNRLDEFNKMALTFHEIIYREAIEYASSNSMVVRLMVAELLDENWKISLNPYHSNII
jgi:hypothetical protein